MNSIEKICKFFNQNSIHTVWNLNTSGKSCLVHRKYRDCFEILALILEFARNIYVSKFFLIKNIGTNSRHIKKYLDLLVQKGLLEISYKNGRVLYKTNEKGLVFLRHYGILKEMLGMETNNLLIVTKAVLPLKEERGTRLNT